MRNKHTYNALLLAALGLLTACETPVQINPNAVSITATLETQPVASSDDAADDPAIWVHPHNPEASLILGTDKRAGLAVYNLDGEQVQFLDQGRLNNVDLRQSVPMVDGGKDIAVATNRTTIGFDIFSIDANGQVEFVLTQPLDYVDPYGICMGLDAQGNAYAFVNDKTGDYQQWLLNPEGRIAPQLVGEFKVPSQPEGCAVRDSTQMLYLGEEEAGFWKMPADASRADEMQMVDRTGTERLTADVEGMDVYEKGDQAWLVVSSQGDFSYAVYDLNDNDRYLGSIRIDDSADGSIDGAQETDGLAVSSAFLGERFAEGLLVVQDGFNELPKDNQNFKLVPWTVVEDAIAK